MRRLVLAMVCALLASACDLPYLVRPPATPAPFCAPFQDQGSVRLDYSITERTLPVSAADAERAARTGMAVAGNATTCSVRLARYENLERDVASVWVIHLDGLEIPSLRGAFFSSPPPSPAWLRRALIVMTTEAPATQVLAIFSGP